MQLDFVIDNYHYDSILYNKELYCEENILLAVPKHFAVNEELGMYQLSYKNIKNKNYLSQKYPGSSVREICGSSVYYADTGK